MNKYDLLETLDDILHMLSTDGSLVTGDIVYLVQNLGGNPNVIYNNSDVTVWMTYLNTLAIRYLLQEN